MKYLTPYRLASYVLLLFCAGHTAGGMLAQKSVGLAGDAVFEAMKAVHFEFSGAESTWYGFWFAFGLTASLFLLFSAIVAWQLSNLQPSEFAKFSLIAWALFGAHVGNAVLTWKYFFTGAGMLATAAAILLGVGAIQKSLLPRQR